MCEACSGVDLGLRPFRGSSLGPGGTDRSRQRAEACTVVQGGHEPQELGGCHTP